MHQFKPLSELWLTMAQAFLPPTRPEVQTAFKKDLADELAVLTEAAGLRAQPYIEVLRRSTQSLAGEALLVHYSSLFLAPPVKAHLNVGYHLDGTISGPAQDAIEAVFSAHGVAKKSSLRDLPDHLSAQLEFLALLGAEAGTDDEAAYARRFLVPVLPRLCREIEAACGLDSPYLHLVRLAAMALREHYVQADDVAAEPRQRRRDPDPAKGVWRNCRSCGKPFARESEIRVLVKALETSGLSAAHLALCPGCRNPLAL